MKSAKLVGYNKYKPLWNFLTVNFGSLYADDVNDIFLLYGYKNMCYFL